VRIGSLPLQYLTEVVVVVVVEVVVVVVMMRVAVAICCNDRWNTTYHHHHLSVCINNRSRALFGATVVFVLMEEAMDSMTL